LTTTNRQDEKIKIKIKIMKNDAEIHLISKAHTYQYLQVVVLILSRINKVLGSSLPLFLFFFSPKRDQLLPI
jgi:hypothetical protein